MSRLAKVRSRIEFKSHWGSIPTQYSALSCEQHGRGGVLTSVQEKHWDTQAPNFQVNKFHFLEKCQEHRHVLQVSILESLAVFIRQFIFIVVTTAGNAGMVGVKEIKVLEERFLFPKKLPWNSPFFLKINGMWAFKGTASERKTKARSKGFCLFHIYTVLGSTSLSWHLKKWLLEL